MKILIAFSVILLVFAVPASSKQINFAPTTTNVEIGQIIEIPILINSEYQKIGAISFNIDFDSNYLEGLIQNQNGSVFPLLATATPTPELYESGAPGPNDFWGEGLLTTLVFKGKSAGSTLISINNVETWYSSDYYAKNDFQINNPLAINVMQPKAVPEPSVLFNLIGLFSCLAGAKKLSKK